MPIKVGVKRMEFEDQTFEVVVKATVCRAAKGTVCTVRNRHKGPYRIRVCYCWERRYPMALKEDYKPPSINGANANFDLLEAFDGMTAAQRKDAIADAWIEEHGDYQ